MGDMLVRAYQGSLEISFFKSNLQQKSQQPGTCSRNSNRAALATAKALATGPAAATAASRGAGKKARLNYWVFYPAPYHPWDWYIYLHENHRNQLNVDKYTVHGWYGSRKRSDIPPNSKFGKSSTLFFANLLGIGMGKWLCRIWWRF